MVNVIIPISKNPQDFVKILDRLGNLESVFVHVGICDSEYDALVNQIGQSDNVYVHAFADGADREEMINSLQSLIGNGPLMIMRKPITMEEFNRFISQNKDVVTCERGFGKFKAFMFMIWQKILKLFLGVKLYDGDPSVIYFSPEISAVISQSGNLSYSSRVDRWRGIAQSTVETKSPPVKTVVNKKNNINFIIFAVVSLLVASTVTTVVCLFAKMSIIIGLLIACVDIIAFAIALIMVIMIAFNSVVGKKHFDRAFEIEKDTTSQE